MGWRDELDELPNLGPRSFALERATTALILVDLQYVDAHRNYGFGKDLRRTHPKVWGYYFDRIEQQVLPNAARLLERFRTLSMRPVFLTLGPQLSDGSDMTDLRRPDVAVGLSSLLHPVGSFEHGILPEVAPITGEVVLNKTSRSAFSSTGIERLLLNLRLTTLVFVGVSTSACVDTTARDAADRGFRVVLVEDATAELDQESHDATLKQFAVRWGRVLSTDEVLASLGINTP